MVNINEHISKVIIIDDDSISNLFNEFVIKDLMHFKGELKICLNGKEGIDYLAIGDHSKKAIDTLPALILLDINMPVMNGFEFIEENEKTDPWLTKNAIVFMLSSSLDTNDHEKSANFKSLAGFLHKPLSADKLIEALQTKVNH